MTTQGGYGAKMSIGGTALAHIMDMEFPEFEKIISDVTAHDSPGGYAEYTASGKRQLNRYKLTLLWDANNAVHQQILDGFDSNLIVEMSCEDPLGQEIVAFDAHVTKINRITKQEEGYTAEVEFQPTGIPSIT